MDITISTLKESDLDAICALQADNLRDNLSADQLRDGFLSIGFSADEFRAFDRDMAVIVAREQGRVIGYCCFSSAAFNASLPILDQLVSRLPSYTVPGAGQSATEKDTCIYGPACIAASWRGKGILGRMFSHGLAFAEKAGYDFCFSFVGAENQRSLNAHLKLPFSQVGHIEHNNRDFIVIACNVQP